MQRNSRSPKSEHCVRINWRFHIELNVRFRDIFVNGFTYDLGEFDKEEPDWIWTGGLRCI